jgi:predicted alpha/beta-hydrolase family hydrolase
MSLPTFIHSHLPTAESANIILHGGSNGIESDFIRKIFASSVERGFTTLAFNFPYKDRGEDNSSGEQLLEEVDALVQMVTRLKADGFTRIALIGKSLGGIVASFYLNSDSRDSEIDFKLGILGFVTDSVKLPIEVERLVIVQGENDRFGNAEAVRAKLNSMGVSGFTLHEIGGADHSYRDSDRNPTHEDAALKMLFAEL